MPQISILTSQEKRRFEQPPTFSKEERKRSFSLSAPLRIAAARIRSHTDRAGFLLQFSYFHAAGRFFPVNAFRQRDVDYVTRTFKLANVDLADYGERTMARHRQLICSVLEWKRTTPEIRSELYAHAQRYVSNQDYPNRILAGLVDLCWKRRFVIPSCTELAVIISECFNVHEQELLAQVEQSTTSRHCLKLDALLAPSPLSKVRRAAAPLTLLKRIDHSLNAGAIKKSMSTLKVFRRHFLDFEPVCDTMRLSDRATQYYATWLMKTDHQQLSQLNNQNKVYVHLLAFIKHQFFRRQDHAIDVLQKSVTTARSFVRRNLAQQDVVQEKQRNAAIEALRKAQLTATEFANGVVAITKSAKASPNEKYYKIESLVHDYLSSDDLASSQQLEAIDTELQRYKRNSAYFELLSDVSLKLQRRIGELVRTVEFDDESPDKNIL